MIAKKESFFNKEKRVVKELSKILNDGKIIVDLSKDQKEVLLTRHAKEVHKCFTFPVANVSAWDENISPLDLEMGFQRALKDAVDYATTNKLVYPSYGIGGNYNSSIELVAWKPINDETLIQYFTDEYNCEKKQRAKEKALKNLSKKTKSIIIDGTKYNLVKSKY